jgi:hypothetical protein
LGSTNGVATVLEGALVVGPDGDATTTLGGGGDVGMTDGGAVAICDGGTVATLAAAAVAAKRHTKVKTVIVRIRVGSIGRSLRRRG